MRKPLLKNISLVFSGMLLTLAIFAAVFFYLKAAFSGFEWSTETRVMLHEVVSPDQKYKFGVYHYDIGALGYSETQASLARFEDDYPINGNMLSGKPIVSASWISESTIQVVSPTTSDLKSGFTLQVNHE